MSPSPLWCGGGVVRGVWCEGGWQIYIYMWHGGYGEYVEAKEAKAEEC